MTNNQILIKPFVVVRTLAIVAVILSVISFSTRFIVYFTGYTSVKGLIPLFYVGDERNFPTAFSMFLLLFAAILLLLITLLKWKQTNSFYKQWAFLCIGFFFLSIDEGWMIHEYTLGHRNSPGILWGYEFSGFFHRYWIIPYILALPFLFYFFWKLLMSLEKRTRNLFVISAVIYLSGTIGMESVGGYIKSIHGIDNWWYYLEVAVEEGLEMAGIILFIYALLDYLNRNHKEIRLMIDKSEK
jgi:hypothetical protein